jgi:hypothetical protein
VPAGRDRRAYVKTLADGGDGSEAADPAPARPARTSTRKREPSKPKKALGRIAIRKVAVVPGNGGPAVVAPGESEFEPREVDTLTEAARAIRRSPDRDRVAELVIDALARFTPGAEAAMLFVIRGTSATGWKHFSRAGAEQPELAVPMDEPGLVPRAATGATVRARASELGPIDARLLKKLTVQGTAELAVVPIAIAGKVMCVLVVAISPESGLGTIETIATSAGTAFARLMRDAGR